MAIHTLESVRCTLAKNDLGYGVLRCDSSGILVCPIPSSSSAISSEESEFSSEEFPQASSSSLSRTIGPTPKFRSSSESIAPSSSSSPSASVSSLESESSSEIPSEFSAAEFVSSSEEQSRISEEEGSPFAPGESSVSALPCDSSNECPSIGCPGCCGVRITEIKTGTPFDPSFCPPSPFTGRDVVLWFYTLDELAAFCLGNGQYCDFYDILSTCDILTGTAFLDFYVCCGCDKV